MKRLFRALALTVSFYTLVCGWSMTANALTATDPPANYLSPVFISAFDSANRGEVDVVELYNASDEAISMNNWSIVARDASGNSCQTVIANESIYVPPKSYVLAAKSGLLAGNPSVRDLVSICTLGAAAASITLHSPSRLEETINGIGIGTYYRLGLTATYRDEDDAFNRNFGSMSARKPASFFAGEWFYRSPNTELTIVAVLPKSQDCSPAEDVLGCHDFVKLYNASTQTIDLSKYRIRSGYARQSATVSNTAYLSGSVPPGGFIAFPLPVSESGTFVWLEDVYGVGVYGETVISVPSASSHEGQAWAFDAQADIWQWTKYLAPIDGENTFTDGTPVNQCEGLRLSEIGANYSPQFIEVENTTLVSLDISGCMLQTNRSETVRYAFPQGTVLGPHQQFATSILDTQLLLTKTTVGVVYLLNSDASTELDVREYDSLAEGSSYALVGGVWQQTYAVTPSELNVYEQYLPCEAGYDRNQETGRCNRLAVATGATLTPCLSTQYRSEETNRCRNLAAATASSTLTPCASNQYRSLETNRCRLLASTASALAPCPVGQERNPETNRCRKVAVSSMPLADFAPTKVAAEAGRFTVNGATIVVLGCAVLGYALWEWRQEIRSAGTAILAKVRKL